MGSAERYRSTAIPASGSRTGAGALCYARGMAHDPKRRRRMQVLLTLAVAAIALVGWMAWKGWLGETGPADPCVGLDGQERAACERMR